MLIEKFTIIYLPSCGLSVIRDLDWRNYTFTIKHFGLLFSAVFEYFWKIKQSCFSAAKSIGKIFVEKMPNFITY